MAIRLTLDTPSRQCDAQDAVFERDADLFLVDIIDGNAALKPVVGPLAEQPLLVLRFGLLLAADDEDAIRQATSTGAWGHDHSAR